jgi:hypothetical protein
MERAAGSRRGLPGQGAERGFMAYCRWLDAAVSVQVLSSNDGSKAKSGECRENHYQADVG